MRTGTGISVEPAEADDVDALVEQWVALAREQRRHDTHILPDANRERIRRDFLSRVVADELLVARESDGTPDSGADAPGVECGIAGFVAFGRDRGRFEEDTERGIVTNLYVRPDRRDAGVGTELLAATEQRLAERGVAVVALEAMADNESARRFYRRRGYAPHRVELEKRLNREDDDRS